MKKKLSKLQGVWLAASSSIMFGGIQHSEPWWTERGSKKQTVTPVAEDGEGLACRTGEFRLLFNTDCCTQIPKVYTLSWRVPSSLSARENMSSVPGSHLACRTRLKSTTGNRLQAALKSSCPTGPWPAVIKLFKNHKLKIPLWLTLPSADSSIMFFTYVLRRNISSSR